MGLTSPDSRVRTSSWRLQAIDAVVLRGPYWSRQPLEDIILAASGHRRCGSSWALLVPTAAWGHRLDCFRPSTLWFFVGLTGPSAAWGHHLGCFRPSTLGFFMGFTGPDSRVRTSYWLLQAIAAVVLHGPYWSRQPREYIILAASGHRRCGSSWALLVPTAAWGHHLDCFRPSTLWFFMGLTGPDSHVRTSSWLLQAIDAVVLHGSYWSRQPLDIVKAASGHPRCGSSWALLVPAAAWGHHLGCFRPSTLWFFMGLTGPDSRLRTSSWLLQAIDAVVLHGPYWSRHPREDIILAASGHPCCGSSWALLVPTAAWGHHLDCFRPSTLWFLMGLTGPHSRLRTSSWLLQAIRAVVLHGPYWSRQQLEDIILTASGHRRCGSSWALLVPTAAWGHRHDCFRPSVLWFFMGLTGPDSSLRTSSWLLQAIDAVVLHGPYWSRQPLEDIVLAASGHRRCGSSWALLVPTAAWGHHLGCFRPSTLWFFVSLTGPVSRLRTSSWLLQAIDAVVIRGPYWSGQPREDIILAASGHRRCGSSWALLVPTAARGHHLDCFRPSTLWFFMGLTSPDSRVRTSFWRLQAIDAVVLRGPYWSRQPLEDIILAASGHRCCGSSWALLVPTAAWGYNLGCFRPSTLWFFMGLTGSDSRLRTSSLLLQAIDAVVLHGPYWFRQPLEDIILAASGHRRWVLHGPYWSRQPREDIILAASGHRRCGSSWALLVPTAAWGHRHGCFRPSVLWFFVGLTGPDSSLRTSSWLLQAIDAVVLHGPYWSRQLLEDIILAASGHRRCGSSWALLVPTAAWGHHLGCFRPSTLWFFMGLTGPDSRLRTSSWLLQAIDAVVLHGPYWFRQPLEDIILAASGHRRCGSSWALLVPTAAWGHHLGYFRPSTLWFFMGLTGPDSRLRTSSWLRQVIDAVVLHGPYWSREPLEDIILAASCHRRRGSLWASLVPTAAWGHHLGCVRSSTLWFFMGLTGPESRLRTSSWRLHAIDAVVLYGPHWSRQPLEDIILAASGYRRWGYFMGHLCPESRLWPSSRQPDAIASGVHHGPLLVATPTEAIIFTAGVLRRPSCSQEPLETAILAGWLHRCWGSSWVFLIPTLADAIALAAWGHCRWGSSWALLIPRAVRCHRHVPWWLEAIAAGILRGPSCSRNPFEAIAT